MPTLDESAARARLSSMLRVTAPAALCLLPAGQQETLCYQFTGEYGGDRYLCFINAHDGSQEEILKLVETPRGIQAV